MAISKINSNSLNTDEATLSFSTSGTERMRIDSSGNIYYYDDTTSVIGCLYDSASHRFSIGNNGAFSITTAGIWLGGYATNGSGYGRMNFSKTDSGNVNGVRFYHSGSSIGGINYNDSSVSYNINSDYRLKENVITITDGIERLKQLNPVKFNFITTPNSTVDGFIAHEAQTVVPEAVTGVKNEVDEDGNPEYQGIDQAKLVPLLTAALQEAVAKIETLEARVAILENV